MDAWGAAGAHWSFEPWIILALILTGTLYWRGMTSTMALLPRGHRLGRRPWRVAAFYGALLTIFLALESPLDYYATTLMWMHMVQHMALIMLAAPLLLLGDPALPLLRGIPATPRRRAIGEVTAWRPVRALGGLWHALSRPWVAFAVFTSTYYAWHWPACYNLTLRSQAAHSIEHLLFLATALIFWRQVIGQSGFRTRLSYAGRALYMFAAALQNHALAVILAFAPVPLYAYANLTHRPGGITALTDQQVAGGIMWVPGMMMYGSAFLICLYYWLISEDQPRRKGAQAAAHGEAR